MNMGARCEANGAIAAVDQKHYSNFIVLLLLIVHSPVVSTINYPLISQTSDM